MSRFLPLFVLCTCFLGNLTALTPPPHAKEAVLEVPVAALSSSHPPQGFVWVRAKIMLQTEDDTYLIKDSTGQITLFLPDDNLLSIELIPGMEILVYGSVDVSPVKPEKNEFYAEQILLPPL